MSKTRLVEPVVRFVAVITSNDAVRQWADQRILQQWGDIAIRSSFQPFTAGGYYTDQMGTALVKQLVAIAPPIDPTGLADWKTQTNQWEQEAAQLFPGAISRPLNLDPGYITQAKLVLATVKDRDHRIYLKDGIFGEITLNYVGKRWIAHRWTYPDYQTEEVFQFAMQCRQLLRKHIADHGLFRLGQRE